MIDPTPSRRTIRVVAAVVQKNERYLITQRRPNAVLPLLWEFPGGKVEPGESDADALRREMNERLGADVEVGQLISFVSHPYEHYTVDLHLYECRLKSDTLLPPVFRSDDGNVLVGPVLVKMAPYETRTMSLKRADKEASKLQAPLKFLIPKQEGHRWEMAQE